MESSEDISRHRRIAFTNLYESKYGLYDEVALRWLYDENGLVWFRSAAEADAFLMSQGDLRLNAGLSVRELLPCEYTWLNQDSPERKIGPRPPKSPKPEQ